jgi:parallel beta-helix repeat protein
MKQILPAILLLALAPLVHAGEIHVSVQGNDTAGDGSAGKPFATPARAAVALAARTPAQRGEATAVVLHAGVYPVRESLALSEKHSGTPEHPVVWRAAGDGRAELSGGVTVPGSALREVKDAATLARLPKKRDESLHLYEIRLADLGLAEFPALNPRGMGRASAAAWPELSQDGAALPVSGFPNGEGFSKGFKPVKVISAGTNAKIVAGGATSTGNTAAGTPMVFAVTPEKAALWKNAMDTHHAALWFGGHWFWDWADDFIPAKSIDDKGAVTMGMRHGYGMGPHVNLRAFNLAEEMDVAGEYAVEPTQKRVLVLLPSGKTKGLSLSWTGSSLITTDKTACIRFENIAFADGRLNAVAIKGGDKIAFAHCDFTRFGDYAVRVDGRNVSVTDSTFTRLGAGAVHLSGGDRKTLTRADNLVTRCRVEDFGRLTRTYAPAVYLNGVGSAVTHCLFSGAPHSAILFGGNEHTIADNEIHSVLTETGDCGAIYGGRDWTTHGTVISGNWIHDLGGSADRWACGVYLDDQMSGVTIRNNRVDKAALGFLIGGGRYNLITDNILSRCAQGISADARGLGWGKSKLMPTLTKRLAEVPVDQEPWKSRYPMLAKTLADRPGAPVGSRITGNAFVACKKPWLNKANGGGAAALDPNFENLPVTALVESGAETTVTGTPIRFVKPEVGPKP